MFGGREELAQDMVGGESTDTPNRSLPAFSYVTTHSAHASSKYGRQRSHTANQACLGSVFTDNLRNRDLAQLRIVKSARK